MKKLTFILTICWYVTFTTYGQVYNFAEALQKSLYFYDAERCGPKNGTSKLEWRGDCHVEDAKIALTPTATNLSQAFITANKTILDPDGDGTVDLSGGYHDAGDHVKFGLPQAYASSTVEWAYFEFRDAFLKTGQAAHMEDVLRGFADYYLRSTFMDATGKVIAFAYQVGEGTVDHNYWGPPELQAVDKYPRPAFFATAATPASDQTAGAAASLALTYLNFHATDPAYAQKCLNTAKALYAFSLANRGLGYSGGFYNSSFDEDELSWAAVWLYTATAQQSYINDIISTDANGQYTGYMKRIIATTANTWQNIWVHSWDTKWGGVFAKLAPITNDPLHWYIFRWNLEYWSHVPHIIISDNAYLQLTPDGFSFLNSWGSARYNAAAIMQAMVYRKYKNDSRFADWGVEQLKYIMGKNPLGRSYIVGYSDNFAQHPHHRAAHGSTTNSTEDPAVHKHILWGALVGGPGASDEHHDVTSDYAYNEVALDYNAGLEGALAGAYTYYGAGQQVVPIFPPKEPGTLEFFASAKIEQENTERSQLTVTMNNVSVHPPSYNHTYKAQYFFNISELIAAGQSISDVSAQVFYDQQGVTGPATIVRGPLPWDPSNGVYYLEFEWQKSKMYGSVDIQFAIISKQDGAWTSHWDPTNDYSHKTLTKDGKTITPFIPVYVDGRLYTGSTPPIVVVPVATISVPSALTIALNTVKTDVPVISPSNATNKNVTWTSSNALIASVDANGAITGNALGSAVITAKTVDGGLTASTTVTVLSAVVSVTDVTLNSNYMVVNKGTSTALSATVLPANATNKGVSWSSNNSAIASVNASGLVSGISAGSAIITVTTADGNKTATCNVSVPGEPTTCTFGTPSASALPSINKAYSNIYIFGTGPNLSNINNFSINWELTNNSLSQISMGTKNGQPGWFVDLSSKVTRKFNVAQPEITITGSGITGFDGSYWVALDGTNFVMSSKSLGFTIYFSTSATAPACAKSAFAFERTNREIEIFPNPFGESINVKNMDGASSVAIYNSNGQKIGEFAVVNSESIIINSAAYPAGFYHIIVRNGSGKAVSKTFVKK